MGFLQLVAGLRQQKLHAMKAHQRFGEVIYIWLLLWCSGLRGWFLRFTCPPSPTPNCPQIGVPASCYAAWVNDAICSSSFKCFHLSQLCSLRMLDGSRGHLCANRHVHVLDSPLKLHTLPYTHKRVCKYKLGITKTKHHLYLYWYCIRLQDSLFFWSHTYTHINKNRERERARNKHKTSEAFGFGVRMSV